MDSDFSATKEVDSGVLSDLNKNCRTGKGESTHSAYRSYLESILSVLCTSPSTSYRHSEQKVRELGLFVLFDERKKKIFHHGQHKNKEIHSLPDIFLKECFCSFFKDLHNISQKNNVEIKMTCVFFCQTGAVRNQREPLKSSETRKTGRTNRKNKKAEIGE